jgi:hypothetical protein
MWKSFTVLSLFVNCLLCAGTAEPISFESRSFDALATEADQIAIGTVTATSSRRTGAREIVTDYRFDNLTIIKGAVPTSSLTLTMLGGTVGTETLAVAGAPTFQRGKRYLVFVSGNGSVMFPLVGGQQGIFQMRKDAASGVSRVHDHAGRPIARLPGRAAKAAMELSADSGAAMSESAFVTAIHGKLAERGAQ